MTQRHDRQTIMRYLDDELDRSERAAFETEMGTDPGLAREIAELKAVDRSLRRAFALGGDVRADGSPVRSRPLTRDRSSSLFFRWMAPMAAGACFVVLGFFAGWQLKPELDQRADLVSWRSAVQDALEMQPSGRPVLWRGARADPLGQIEVKRTYRTFDGHYCREFQSTLTAGATTLAGSGIACRSADGFWKIETLTLRTIDDGPPAPSINPA